LKLTEAEYFTRTRDLDGIDDSRMSRVKAGFRLRFEVTAGLTADKLALDRLTLYLRGSDGLSMRIYEQMLANALALVVRPTSKPAPWHELLGSSHIHRVGFSDEEALLPYTSRSFQGYRLLHEYFAFPERFMFVELSGLSKAMRRISDKTFELLVLLDRRDGALENVIDPSHFSLFCTPAINLFPKRAGRIHLNEKSTEHHVLPDRTRPTDFEVYSITEVTGHGTGAEQTFMPFYAATNTTSRDETPAYYTVSRRPRVASAGQRTRGNRAPYNGNEVYLSLVDANQAPYDIELRQLGVRCLCTNRDLPQKMPIGQGPTDFTLEISAPVQTVRCVAGPTPPRESHPEGESAWRLVDHLSLNYLSLVDADDGRGAEGLRDLLTLYGDVGDRAVRKQVEGVVSVDSRAIMRRVPSPGQLAFARGIEVTLGLDERSFEGSGVFLLGAVLEQFFAKHVSINSFTETVIRTNERGEVMRWPARPGRRATL